jgi:hypothetical protein
MSAEIQILKQRPAKGEITIEEYNLLKQILSNTPESSEKEPAPLESKEKTKQLQSIDSSLSLEVGDNFRVDSYYIFYDGMKYPLSDIKLLCFYQHSETTDRIFFGIKEKTTSLGIILDDGFKINLYDIKRFANFSDGEIAPQIINVYCALAKKTLGIRLDKALSELESTGKLKIGYFLKKDTFSICEIGDVYITIDGELLKDDGQRVSLRDAYQNGIVHFGTDNGPKWIYCSILEWEHNPNGVEVSLDRKTNSPKFVFELGHYNRDISMALIKFFSKDYK